MPCQMVQGPVYYVTVYVALCVFSVGQINTRAIALQVLLLVDVAHNVIATPLFYVRQVCPHSLHFSLKFHFFLKVHYFNERGQTMVLSVTMDSCLHGWVVYDGHQMS